MLPSSLPGYFSRRGPKLNTQILGVLFPLLRKLLRRVPSAAFLPMDFMGQLTHGVTPGKQSLSWALRWFLLPHQGMASRCI